MAKAGDEIFNPRTGQRMVFLETGGRSLRIDTYNPRQASPNPSMSTPLRRAAWR